MTNDDAQPMSVDSDCFDVKSRYVDLEGVTIDLLKVPELFRHLISLASYWSIGDDAERIKLMGSSGNKELRALIDAVEPLDGEIWKWCSSHHHDIPVPHEVVIYGALLQAAAEAKVMLG